MAVPVWAAKLIKPIADLVDSLHVSGEERGQLRLAFAKMQGGLATKALEYEVGLIEAQARIITAEASAQWAITATWRPIMMLSFGGLLWWYALAATFGFTPPDFSTVPPELWELMKWGLGGYVGGRSAEKITTSIMDRRLDFSKGKGKR